MRAKSVSVRVQRDANTSVQTSVNTFLDEATEKARLRYGRVPLNVIADSRLTDRDVRVFCAMALLERGGVVKSGMRAVSEASQIALASVCASTKRLSDTGHIERTEYKRGQRQELTFTSKVFSRKNTRERASGVERDSKMSREVQKARKWAARANDRDEIAKILAG